jgi:hypothetical protein
MSNSSPARFHENKWTSLEVLGWIMDRDPDLFGRLKCLDDIDHALLRSRVRFPPLNEAPDWALACALRKGKVTAFNDGQALPPDNWSGSNIDDAVLFDREAVLKLWPILEWLPLRNATAAIRRHSGARIPEAEALLIEACLDGIIQARTPDFEIPASWWLKARIDGSSLHSLAIDDERPKEYRMGKEHELQDVEISASGLRRWITERNGSVPIPAPGANPIAGARRGPEPGKLRRYDAADRALFPKIGQIMRRDKISCTAAVRILTEHKKIVGTGSLESSVKRVVRFYRRSRPKLADTR